MTLSPCRQLTAFLLLVMVLLAPCNAIAHDLAMMETYACQVLQGECTNDGSGQSDTSPCNESEDGCDYEECSQDSIEQPHVAGLNTNQSPSQLCHSEPANAFPKVYLAIFVPPES